MRPRRAISSRAARARTARAEAARERAAWVAAAGARAAWVVAAIAGVVAGAAGAPGSVAAQWVEEPGAGWTALAVYRQDTRRHYGADGEARAFFAEGRAVTTSSFLTVALGLAPGVDGWGQFSFHRLRYDDLLGDRMSTGFGDMRFWLRAAPLQWLGVELPVAVRAGAKLPAGDFDVNADVVPLGDGQRDWEVMIEAGHSFWPRSLYLSGWVGYRWREANPESLKDFGNELFYFLQAGGRIGPVGLKAAVDGWDGAAGATEGVAVPSFQRDLVQIQSFLGLAVGPGEVEVGARFALSGRNLPAGPALLVQYFARWGQS